MSTAAIAIPEAPPNAPFLVGLGATHRHAVHRHAVADAIAATSPTAWSLCGVSIVPAGRWGAFEHDNRYLATDRCPRCAWIVAIEQDLIDKELEAIGPGDDELPHLVRVLPDPYLVVRICSAILRAARDADGVEHPHTASLLGHATAHSPTLIWPSECLEGDCDHDTDPATGGCVDGVRIVCPACSVQAGSYAGEREGRFTGECTVSAPCDVLRAFAKTYELSEHGFGEVANGRTLF